MTRRVRCDAARIQQLAANLLANALAHGAPDRPVKITAFADQDDFVLGVFNEVSRFRAMLYRGFSSRFGVGPSGITDRV